MDVTWAPTAMILSLVQIFFDTLGLAQQVRGVLIGYLNEPLHRLERLDKFIGKLLVLLILPTITQRGETPLQRRHSVLEISVKTLKFLGKPPDLLRIHDCLRHKFLFAPIHRFLQTSSPIGVSPALASLHPPWRNTCLRRSVRPRLFAGAQTGRLRIFRASPGIQPRRPGA